MNEWINIIANNGLAVFLVIIGIFKLMPILEKINLTLTRIEKFLDEKESE